MTDWQSVAKAHGMNADEKLIGSLELLESQFRPLESRIAHETEPAIFYVLQPGDGE